MDDPYNSDALLYDYSSFSSRQKYIIGLASKQCVTEADVPFPLKGLSLKEWYLMSKWATMTENMMRKYQDNIVWCFIGAGRSPRYKLSEEFIIEFADRLDLKWVSKFQPMRDELLVELSLKGYINNHITYPGDHYENY